MTDQEIGWHIFHRMQDLKNEAEDYPYKLDFITGRSEDSELGELILAFSRSVYSKARAARDKYGFHPLGWATPDWEAELQHGILEHLQKGDPRDVAVYAMFAWFHGWSTAASSPVGGPTEPSEFNPNFEWGRLWLDETGDRYYPARVYEGNALLFNVPHKSHIRLVRELLKRAIINPALPVGVQAGEVAWVEDSRYTEYQIDSAAIGTNAWQPVGNADYDTSEKAHENMAAMKKMWPKYDYRITRKTLTKEVIAPTNEA